MAQDHPSLNSARDWLVDKAPVNGAGRVRRRRVRRQPRVAVAGMVEQGALATLNATLQPQQPFTTWRTRSKRPGW